MAGISSLTGMVGNLQVSLGSIAKRVQEGAQTLAAKAEAEMRRQALAAPTTPPTQSPVTDDAVTLSPPGAGQAGAAAGATRMPGPATDIGVIVRNTSRLNVFNVLGKEDAVEFHKFKVAAPGPLTLGRVGDEGVRVQMLDGEGKVFADSEPSTGDRHMAYRKLTAGSLVVGRGDYALRVSRDRGVPATSERKYALQLRMGSYVEDHDTFAKPAGEPVAVPSYVRSLRAMVANGDPLILGRMAGGIGSAVGRGALLNAVA